MSETAAAPACRHCGDALMPERDYWVHAHNLYRCQHGVAYGHNAAHPDVPCEPGGPNPCMCTYAVVSEADPATTWNYRGCIERTEDGPIFTVREVYYGPDGALSWTAEPCYPQADSWKDLCEELILMERGAMDRRYLDITEAPGVWVDHNGRPVEVPGELRL